LRGAREELIQFDQIMDNLAQPLGNIKVGTLQSLAKESIITNPEIDHDGLPETVKTVMDQQTGGRRTRRQKRRSRRSRKQTI